jgi:hypothetical protein
MEVEILRLRLGSLQKPLHFVPKGTRMREYPACIYQPFFCQNLPNLHAIKYIIERPRSLDYWKTPILQNQCLNASIKTPQGESYKKVDKALREKKCCHVSYDGGGFA